MRKREVHSLPKSQSVLNSQSTSPTQPEPVVVQPAPVPTQASTASPLSHSISSSPLRTLVLRELGSAEDPPFPGLVGFPEVGVENKKLEQGQVLPRRKNKWLWWPKKYQNLYKSVRL
jgi:hypothetical protein